MKKHHSKCRNRLKGEVPGGHSRKKVELVTETGGIPEQKLWDTMLVRIRNHWDTYKLLKQFCKVHGLAHCVAGKRGEEALEFGDRYDEWYEVTGGEAALNLLSVGYSWVKEWSWAISTGAPRGNVAHFHKDNAKSEALPKSFLAPVISHCRRPKVKERAFVWHEAGETWVDMSWEDLQADMQAGLLPLFDGDQIIDIKGRVGGERTTPYVWRLGCARPIQWSWNEGCWVDAGNCQDKGKATPPVLVKEWFGQVYLFYWLFADGQRSGYYPDPKTAKILMERGLPGDCKKRAADGAGYALPPLTSKCEFENGEGFIGK